ncbi:Dihydropteridine reductase [Smittium culicis]|uniref:Dihydropteridine reductase n=2 Tax=Smittium culicis TaxID=133412 RepID=A0A1R1YIB3_9FUNG|nr:Dihydropteridine reductase [Smittium culicis]
MPSAIIYGSSGSLGSEVVSLFKNVGWDIIGIDLVKNSTLDKCVVVDPNFDLLKQGDSVCSSIKSLGASEKSFDAIIVVSGGWAGGNAASQDFFASTDLSLKQSVYTSAIGAKLASLYLKENGVAIFTGAQAALDGTPGMIGYGFAKAAVHQLVKSLAMDGSGLSNNSRVYCILPVTLDTQANRNAMPTADKSSWTPILDLSL